jgi:hypothetical protein
LTTTGAVGWSKINLDSLDPKVFLLSIISFAITKLKAYSILSIGHIQIEGM